MANRTMEAKRLKMKKQRRLFPRNYSSDYIPTGKPPNRLVMQEYRERTLSLAFDAKYLAALEAKQKFHGVPPGKVEIRAKLEEMAAEGYATKVGFVLIANTYQRCTLYRRDDHKGFRLCHEDFKAKTVRWSIEYPSKERAITVWHKSKVVWIEKKSLSG